MRSQLNAINDIRDFGGFLLLATEKGLWKFDKKTKSFHRPKVRPGDESWLSYSSVVRFLGKLTAENETWMYVQHNLIRVDSNFFIQKRFPLPDSVTMLALDREKSGVLWFGSWKSKQAGLYRYDPDVDEIVNLRTNADAAFSLSSDHINDVMIDADQNVWISTDRGVNFLRRKDLRFYNSKLEGARIWANTISLSKDNEHLIISAQLYNKRGSQLFEAPISVDGPGTFSFRPLFRPTDGLTLRMFKGKRHFWITSLMTGIIGYPIDSVSGTIMETPVINLKNDPNNENTITTNTIQGVWEDGAGSLWLTNQGQNIDCVNTKIPYGSEGSVVRYNFGGGVNDYFYAEDDTSFWLIHNSNLDLIHLSSGTSAAYNEHVLEIKEVPNVLYKAADKTLFVGTANGLYFLSKTANKYKLEPVRQLLKFEINGIQEDRLGRLWIYGDNKLMCFDRKDSISTVFDQRDGIGHFRAIETGWLNKTSNGMLIMASPDGLTSFDPATFQINRKKTRPVLTKLEVNNSPVSGTGLEDDPAFKIQTDITLLKEVTLDYLHNNFTIEFSAMEMTAPEKNRYQYTLEGYNSTWVETDRKHREATYTNLPPGDYVFKVKASNNHGVWSDDERNLTVTILPPPWRTWWAYAGYGILIAVALFGARRTIVKEERLKANLQLARIEQEQEHFELEKAKEVDRAKTFFFTNISHEFRTPLTLIKGPVQSIIEQFLSDQKVIDRQKIVEQLKLVQRNSDLLLKLINQLLDLAKLESGTLKVEKSEGDLYAFIRAMASSFASFAAQKNIPVQVEIPSGNCPALFDKDRLETISINLINNAIKFTPSNGSVTVRAVVENRWLSLSVIDTGIGISQEHQVKIFERFHQVSEADKAVGTGIGLALVKELVILLGGTIIVISEPGKGSEFKVALPMELLPFEHGSESTAVQPIEPKTINRSNNDTGSNNDETKSSVLVVEDNSDLRAFIIDSLGSEFYFLEADNGKRGLEIARSEIPDLIISDVMMPEMDGITMSGKIKSDVHTCHIPLILLTAKSTEDSKLSGLQSGADDYLTKPFNKNELLFKVRNSIATRAKLRERLRAELMSTAPKVDVLSADEQFLNDVKEGILNRLGDEQLSVESLAEDIGMSRVQLYRKVSGLTGLSVNELIRKLRLQRAAQLLGQNWGPVSQVAYEVGYSNLSYFSKVFKEEYGVLPSEYEKA